MADSPIHLLDVNVVLALADQAHIHHEAADDWFQTPGLQWALCAFTEAGILRLLTNPKIGELSMEQVTAILVELKQRPGYHFQPITADWRLLTKPFFKRIHGHNQVTDAYLLGLAIAAGHVLATFDKTFLHLAGEHKRSVLILED